MPRVVGAAVLALECLDVSVDICAACHCDGLRNQVGEEQRLRQTAFLCELPKPLCPQVRDHRRVCTGRELSSAEGCSVASCASYRTSIK